MPEALRRGDGVRRVARAGQSAALLLAIMFCGSLVLWVGIPVGWLWVASQVQAETGSLGLALLVAMAGVLASIAAVVVLLQWLSALHREVRAARGQEDLGGFPLEVVMVCSAVTALVLFSAWFFLLSGSSPIPVNLSL